MSGRLRRRRCGAHRLLRLPELFHRQTSQIAGDDDACRNDVGLAERRPARLSGVHLNGRPADYRGRVERQVRPAGEPFAKRIEDARRFEDRAVAERLAEDLR